MKTTFILFIIVALSFLTPGAPAENLGVHQECDCPAACCERHIEIVKETKYCWEVGHKQVCIPPVCCPWLEWLPLGKGGVRTVNVLEKHEWECEKPVSKWVPVIDHACAGVSPAAGALRLRVPTAIPQPQPARRSAAATFLVRRLPATGPTIPPSPPVGLAAPIRR